MKIMWVIFFCVDMMSWFKYYICVEMLRFVDNFRINNMLIVMFFNYVFVNKYFLGLVWNYLRKNNIGGLVRIN